jgi:hypothetical protein
MATPALVDQDNLTKYSLSPEAKRTFDAVVYTKMILPPMYSQRAEQTRQV